MNNSNEGRWLLLIHQLPPKPDYFRVKIWRRLQRLGAVAIKNSVYVLPKNDQTQEDFQWVLREIVEGGGDASLCEARFVEGLSDDQVEALFQAARATEYDQVAREDFQGKTWVTRKGIYVDRMASAWFIRRFIDSGARFKFVPAKGYNPLSGELRFDMFEAEFTHEGDRCTLEVLIERTGLNEPALGPIAEIVHDIDLKDSKYSRQETAGID